MLKFIVYKVTFVCARACGDARQAASTLLVRARAAAVRAAARTCAMHVAFCCVLLRLCFGFLGVRGETNCSPQEQNYEPVYKLCSGGPAPCMVGRECGREKTSRPKRALRESVFPLRTELYRKRYNSHKSVFFTTHCTPALGVCT